MIQAGGYHDSHGGCSVHRRVLMSTSGRGGHHALCYAGCGLCREHDI